MSRPSVSTNSSTSHLPTASTYAPSSSTSTSTSTPAGGPAASTSRNLLVQPFTASLAGATAGSVDGHLWEYFMIELAPQVLAASRLSLIRTSRTRRLLEADLVPTAVAPAVRPTSLPPGGAAPSAPSGKAVDRDEPTVAEVEEAYRIRMDGMGYRVGWVLSERLCRERLRFPQAAQSAAQSTGSNMANAVGVPDTLEVVKFICKDLWSALYDKQIDNLRTNHRGTYVLQDNAFKPFLRLSGPTGSDGREVDAAAGRLVPFPVGMIRGALGALGIQSSVTAEAGGSTGPQCTFQIRTAPPPTVVVPATPAKA